MSNKKYELLKDEKNTLKLEFCTVYRIKALKDIINEKGENIVKKGELGGYIESEENLSHKRSCWVYDDSKVYGDVRITGNSIIKNESDIEGSDSLFVKDSVISNCEIYGEETIRNSELENLTIDGDGFIVDIKFKLDKKYKDDYYLDTEDYEFLKLENGPLKITSVFLNKSIENSTEGDIFISEKGKFNKKLKDEIIQNSSSKFKRKFYELSFKFIKEFFDEQRKESMR